jgi:hypothetical protein
MTTMTFRTNSRDHWLGALVLACISLFVMNAASADVLVRPDHRASQLKGLRFVDCVDGRARFEATEEGRSLVAVRADGPLHIQEVRGAKAKLKIGWNGTVEYSHYILELDVTAAGAVEVQFVIEAVPSSPIPTTPHDQRLFEDRMRNRPSRFPDDPERFREWQATYRKLLIERLMSGQMPARVPLEPRRLKTTEFPKFILHRIEYHSRSDRRNVMLVSLPKGVSNAPLLLGLHGHEAAWGGADERAYEAGHADDFMAYFAERGWAVVQPATMNHQLQYPEWTLQGEWTWDAIVALDYAVGLPEVDPQRVAVCGLSTGAHLAMNVLALDDRVKAGVVGCILSSWNHCERRCRLPPHCDCGILEQLGKQIEQCDWAALGVPKHVQFQHGLRDSSGPGADEKLLDLKWNTGVFPMAEYNVVFGEVQRAFRVMDRSQATETEMHGGAHKVDNEAAYRWLNTWATAPSR